MYPRSPWRGAGALAWIPTREQLRLVRKARRHTDRRSTILGAASRRLASQGTKSFTVRAVAAAPGVSKPAVCCYSDSKD
jgi:AcrR family transcriptional regulator